LIFVQLCRNTRSHLRSLLRVHQLASLWKSQIFSVCITLFMKETPYEVCEPLHAVSFTLRLITHGSYHLYYHHSDLLLLLQSFISGSRLLQHVFHHRLYSSPTRVIPRTISPSNFFMLYSTTGCVCCVCVTRTRLLSVFKCKLNHSNPESGWMSLYVPGLIRNGEVNVPSSNSTVFRSTPYHLNGISA